MNGNPSTPGLTPWGFDLPIPAGTTSLGIDLTVFASRPDQLVDLATSAKAVWSIVVTQEPVEGISVLDGPTEPPSIVRIDEAALDSLCSARLDAGAAVQRLRGLSLSDAAVLLKLNTQLRIARALTNKDQVLVLDDEVDNGDLASDFAGADELVLVGHEVVEELPATGSESAEFVVAPVGPVTIAGMRIERPEERVKAYLAEYPDTIRRYDGTAGTFAEVTVELIAATRVLRSRISHDEATWFIERAATAPWDTIDADALLTDADPCVVGGLYDRASALYAHFRAQAPKGIKAAKVYKVLHLMRPGLFPILDSRLGALYDAPARAIAPVVNKCRPDIPATKQAFWAAIRVDLISAAAEIAAIRASLKGSGDAYLAAAADSLSDLRILDILAWQGEEPSEE